MIRESDIQWWVLEANKHPEAAPGIIEELGKRLLELDAENERLRGELLRRRSRGPAPSTTDARLETLQHKVETLQDILQRREATDGSLILLSDRLQALQIPLTHAQEWAAEERPVLDARAMLATHSLACARSGDELLILTNHWRGFKRLLADIPNLAIDPVPAQHQTRSQPAKQWPADPDPALEAGERSSVMIPTGMPPRFWTVVSRRGYVQRLVRVASDQKIARGEPLLQSPIRKDAPAAIVSGDRQDILIFTRWGKAVRFAQRAIETHGSIALDLESDDQVAAALALDGGPASGDVEILIATASGYAMRRKASDVPRRVRLGSAGKTLIQAQDVLAAFDLEQATTAPELLFMTYSGKLVIGSTSAIPLHERMSKGTRLEDLDRDPAIGVTLAR
jgi:DNA gyrase/topoisomerase IV subunit A